MKKLLSIILTLVAFSSLYAQDTIRLRSGEIIPAQVQEIGISEIRYKQWSNLEGPTYVQPKSNVLSISYKNGAKENFITVPSQDQTNTSSSSSTDQAFSDALNPNHYPLTINLKSDSYLTLNGRELTEHEAKQILGEDDYGTFLAGIHQRKATGWMIDLGLVSGILGGVFIGVGEGLLGAGIGLLSVGIPIFIVGCVLYSGGLRKANNVLSDYNSEMTKLKNSSPATLSFNLSPVSAGLTLSF